MIDDSSVLERDLSPSPLFPSTTPTLWVLNASSTTKYADFLFCFSALDLLCNYCNWAAMSTNPALSLVTSKNACPPSQTPSPSQSQSGFSLGIESHTQRRAGSSGNFGAGHTSRSASSAARNNQSLRKQHKGQRRPRLADEDAAAESVCQIRTCVQLFFLQI